MYWKRLWTDHIRWLYRAPASAPTPSVVNVTATSLADLSQSGTASIFIGASFNIGVSVSPTSATLMVGNTQRFTATVTGTGNTAVNWSLAGAGCSGSTCGAITSSGLYVAPASVPSPAQVIVTATSLQDTTKSAAATVTVAPPVAVIVQPQLAKVVIGTQQQFLAHVTGTTNTSVAWSLGGAGCSGSACGSLSSSGLYTAPNAIPSPAQVSITATSLADPTKSSTATATIVPPVVVTVSPKTAQVVAGKPQQFTATVTGSSDTSVSWKVSGAGCTGSACGVVSGTGLYRAPSVLPSPASVTVTATSDADVSKSSSAAVTLLPPVVVKVSPASTQVVAGKQQQFTATVTGSTDTSVTWDVSGAGCTGNACGTINSSGLYTAPTTVPSPAQVNVTATSVADPSKLNTAIATIVPSVAVNISPTSAQVVVGKQQQFTASVTGSANTSVTWSISGVGCTGSACGTITSSGLYTAPIAVPSPAQISIKATSVADSTKSNSVTVTVLPLVVVSVSPSSAQVLLTKQQQFIATVTGTTNTKVTWSVSGSGCSGSTCGTVTSAGLYTAPANVPNPAQVSVTATSVADPAKSSAATVTVIPPVVVSVSPVAAQVVAGGQQQFQVTVTGTTNKAVSWSLSGSGCSGSSCGTVTSGGLYSAPAIVPGPAQITLTAKSIADPTKSASATITIVAAVVVKISPATAHVVIGTNQQFTATVTGSTDTSVKWSLIGASCTGSACGTISSSGQYTAPTTIPNPPQVTVTATSNADPSKSASAIVTVVPPTVVAISPTTAQVVAGHTQQFTAVVKGNPNKGVTWSVSGTGCNGARCGTVTSSGLYTAPAVVPNPALVAVKATSNADTTKSATAAVTIVPPVVVSVSPPAVQVMAGNKQQFMAAVTGSTNSAVTWTLSGTGCSGAACGTINSAGLYTAPSAIPQPSQVRVTATSKADPTKAGEATVTVIQRTVVTVSPTAAIVPVKGQQQFRSTVSGNLNTSVTWSLSGTGCSGAACGTIDKIGLYTAPPSIPNPADVKVTAASQAAPSQTASATVLIVASNNAKLIGQYAFLFNGFDGKGAYEEAGSFTADGTGKLTSGREDVNRTDGVARNIGFTGTYQVTADDRATFTMTSALGTFTFKLSLSQLGDKGRFIEFDESGIRGAGVLERQDATAFKTSAFSGGYAISLNGQNVTGARIGAVGVMYPSGSGAISGGSLDVNDGGAVSPTFGSFNGILSVAGSGRGLSTLNITGFDGGTFNFALYVISRSEFFMVSLDLLSANNPLLAGSAELQSGTPFLNSAFTGPSVFGISGMSRSATDVTVGRIVFDGNQVVAVKYDEDNSGLITSNGSYTGAYDTQLNGRGTINLDNEANGQTATWYFYAIAPGRAFLMDASTSTVAMGEMKPQSPVAKYSNLNMFGSYAVASGAPAGGNAQLLTGTSDFDGSTNGSGRGIVSGAEDISQSSGLLPDQAVDGTYKLASPANNGRGFIVLSSPVSKNIVLWVTSPTEALGVDSDSFSTQPTILHFEQ